MVTSLPSSTLMPSSRRPPRWRSRTNTRGRTVICWIWCAVSWCSPRPLPKKIWILADTRSSPPSTIGGIALDPKTGEVLSVYAGSDYLSKQLNNADQAVFEPGSTMKPFALLGAAQSGVSFDTLFNGNSHQHFTGLDQEVNNALENNWGNINLYQAPANSVNTKRAFRAISMKTPCTTCWASTP